MPDIINYLGLEDCLTRALDGLRGSSGHHGPSRSPLAAHRRTGSLLPVRILADRLARTTLPRVRRAVRSGSRAARGRPGRTTTVDTAGVFSIRIERGAADNLRFSAVQLQAAHDGARLGVTLGTLLGPASGGAQLLAGCDIFDPIPMLQCAYRY